MGGFESFSRTTAFSQACSVAVFATVLSSSTAWAQTTEADPLDHAARVAQETCRVSSTSGYQITAGGEANAALKGVVTRLLFGGEGGAGASADIHVWDGIQQVLREHQAQDNADARECSEKLLPELLRFKLEWRMMTAPVAGGTAPDPLDQGCYPADRLRSEAIPIKRGTCFYDKTGAQTAQITRATPDIVEYNSATGKAIRCYPNMDCSFGFQDRGIFSMRARDNNIYLVGRR